MSLLDANADSLRAASLNSYYDPGKRPEPGIFSNVLPGAGNYFMRGMAESGRALSMAGAAVPVLADKLIGSDNRGESYSDRYFRWHDETFNRAVDYWTPKPGEVGAAGQVVGSLAAGLTQFLANPALLIGTAQLSTAEDLVRQGVDAGAANVAGDVAGLSTVAGIALPIFGKTLAGKIATGAAGNLATNIPQAAITRAVVQASGAPKGVAEQFDPFDVRARLVDLLMGIAFGAKSHLDARLEAKQRAFLEGGIPSKPTAIADAVAQAFESPLTAIQRDAIMVMNAARHMDEAALPWSAGEAEHTAAVDNVRTAIAQISRGQEVDVPPVASGTKDAVPADNGLPYQIDHKPMADGGGASRLHDLTPAFGEDIYGPNALQFFGSGDPREKSVLRTLVAVRDKPDATVTIYRGVPADALGINAGDWVTLDKRVAQDFADQHEGGKVVSKKVPASDVTAWADSLLEYGYFPKKVNDLAEAIAEAAPKSAEPVAAPEMHAVSEPSPTTEPKASSAPRFAEDLRVPSGEFDPQTGDPKTISANEHVAKAAAEAEQVKATAEGLMRTVATCILGGI